MSKKLQQHDWVEWAGVRGVVLTTEGPKPEAPLQVVFPNQKIVVGFKADGRFLDWHVASSLKLVKRPRLSMWQRLKAKFKKKVEKNVEPKGAA